MSMVLFSRNVKFDEEWLILLDTIRKIIHRDRFGSINQSLWQERFSNMYKICKGGDISKSHELYHKTESFLEEHCQRLATEIDESENNILVTYVKHWNSYKVGAENLNCLYFCLNGEIAKKVPRCFEDNSLLNQYLDCDEDSYLEIEQLALNCWAKYAINPLSDKLVKLVLEQIQLDRTNQCFNPEIVKIAIMSLVDVYKHRFSSKVHLYESLFEEKYLQETRRHYQEMGNNYVNQFNCVEYMKKALSLIDDEEFRSRKFLNSTSYIKIQTLCLECLVCNHFDLLKNNCNQLVIEEDLDALKNMYKLLKPTPIGVDHIVECLGIHISNTGYTKVQSLRENVPVLFVEIVLEVYNKYLNIIKDIFADDIDFIKTLDKSIAIIVNKKYDNGTSSGKTSELLAMYCDGLLKRSIKTSNDSELEEKLLNGIKVFNYLDDKDYFQRFYQKLLARRLMNQQSNSMDSEEFMLGKLKELCGYEYTTKLSRMFQDIKMSSDLNTKFVAHLHSANSSDQKNTTNDFIAFDFSINVLQINAWPISPVTTHFVIPYFLEKPRQLFETFYDKHYTGRKLYWMYNLSTCEIRVHSNQLYFITMSTYQAAILMMFNECQCLQLSEIQETIKLSTEEMSKQISSLIENKILLSDTIDLAETSKISVNPDFQNKRAKFRISINSTKDANQESKATLKAADDDRKFYIQAVIVRILKARQTLNHTILIDEIITLSKQRFTPSISLIKKCIEILIDKQYIGRKSADEYSYIA